MRCNIVVSVVDRSTSITTESDDLDEKALARIPSRLQEELKALLT